MSPTIDSYIDWVHHQWPSRKVQWEMFSKKMGSDPRTCPKREKFLLKIFEKSLRNLNSPDDVAFASSHSEISNYIGENSDLIIHSIDHRHDIYYSEWNDPHTLNDHNWVWWLDKSNQVESYTWFGNKNSESYDRHMALNCSYFTVFDRCQQPMADPDFIFVCESPMWVPPSRRPLFRTMRTLLNNYF